MIEDTVCNLLNTLNDNGFFAVKMERQTKKFFFFKSVICLSLGCEQMFSEKSSRVLELVLF